MADTTRFPQPYPIGATDGRGTPVALDVTKGHVLITGQTSTGRAALVHNLARALSLDPAPVRVDLIDFAQVTPVAHALIPPLPELTGGRPSTLVEANQLATDVAADMNARFGLLRAGSTSRAMPVRVLIVNSAALSVAGLSTDVVTSLRKVLRHGRAVSVFAVVAAGYELAALMPQYCHQFRTALHLEGYGRARFTDDPARPAEPIRLALPEVTHV